MERHTDGMTKNGRPDRQTNEKRDGRIDRVAKRPVEGQADRHGTDRPVAR